jgi:hypothetical protein
MAPSARTKRFFAALFAAVAARSAVAAVFIVTTAADAGPGSLRQAMLDANAASGADTIAFAIGAGGPATIGPLSPLPAVTEAVTIDGTTQPGFAGSPLIELDGAQAGEGADGLDDVSGGSTFRGLAIGGFDGRGIRLAGTETSVVEGCFVGLDVSGTVPRGNRLAGVAILAGAHRIGGGAAGSGNVIAGQAIGIVVDSPDPGSEVLGNWIGLRADGLPTGSSLGLQIRSPATRVGGSTAGSGNVISGHQGDAVHIDIGADGTILRGNRVGTDTAGLSAVPNTANGVSIVGAHGIVVGGAEPGAGNLVSGNGGSALVIRGDGNIVQGNFLGTDVTGLVPLGNGGGIQLGEATGSVLGGAAEGEGNVIAYNADFGVAVSSGLGNTIRGNAIHSNGRIGIDLLNGDLASGHTANDEGDPDEGANHLQNFPLVELVESVPLGTRIVGSLRGAPGSYVIDFYTDFACAPRPRSLGQARAYLGEALVSIEEHHAPQHEGEAHFDVTLAVSVPADAIVTATATDAGGNTSEISSGIVFDVAPRSGSASGGEALVVFGTDFASDAAVFVGGTLVSSLVVDGTTIAAVSPGLPPGTVAPVTVVSPTGPGGVLSHAWIADFLDVPPSHPFHESVVALAGNGIAAGCGSGLFCVENPLTRAQAAPLLLRARNGICEAPPPCTGIFADVPCSGMFADWIEALAAADITAGCGGDDYCPDAPLRRDQISVLLLKTRFGSSYLPPPCAGVFADVECPGPFTDWVEDLNAKGIAAGCGAGLYCPDAAVTRGQMAALLTTTFGLE